MPRNPTLWDVCKYWVFASFSFIVTLAALLFPLPDICPTNFIEYRNVFFYVCACISGVCFCLLCLFEQILPGLGTYWDWYWGWKVRYRRLGAAAVMLTVLTGIIVSGGCWVFGCFPLNFPLWSVVYSGANLMVCAGMELYVRNVHHHHTYVLPEKSTISKSVGSSVEMPPTPQISQRLVSPPTPSSSPSSSTPLNLDSIPQESDTPSTSTITTFRFAASSTPTASVAPSPSTPLRSDMSPQEPDTPSTSSFAIFRFAASSTPTASVSPSSSTPLRSDTNPPEPDTPSTSTIFRFTHDMNPQEPHTPSTSTFTTFRFVTPSPPRLKNESDNTPRSGALRETHRVIIPKPVLVRVKNEEEMADKDGAATRSGDAQAVEEFEEEDERDGLVPETTLTFHNRLELHRHKVRSLSLPSLFQTVTIYSSMPTAFVGVTAFFIYLMTLARSYVLQILLHAAYFILFLGWKEATLQIHRSYLFQSSSRYISGVFWLGLVSDSLLSIAYLSMSAITFGVVTFSHVCSLLSFIFWLSPKGLALKQTLLTPIYALFGRVYVLPRFESSLFRASVSSYIDISAQIMANIVYIVMSAAMRYLSMNPNAHFFAGVPSSDYLRSIWFALIRIVMLLVFFFVYRWAFLRRFESEFDPLRVGVHVMNRYLDCAVGFTTGAALVITCCCTRFFQVFFWIYTNPAVEIVANNH